MTYNQSMRRTRLGLGLGALMLVAGIMVAVRGGDTTPVLVTMPLSQRGWSLEVDSQRGTAFILSAGDFGANVHLTMVDVRTGALLRSMPLPASLAAFGLDRRTGRVFMAQVSTVQTPNGILLVRVLNARTGAVLYLRHLGTFSPGSFSNITVDEAYGRVFVLAGNASGALQRGADNRISVLDARNGRLQQVFWHVAPTGYLRLAVDGHDNRLIIMGLDIRSAANATASITVRDAQNGRLLLQRTAVCAVALFGLAVDATTGRVFIMTGPTGVSTTPPPSVCVLDVRSGRLVRITAVGSNPGEIDVDEQTGHVFVVCTGPMTPVMYGSGGNGFVLNSPVSSGRIAMLDAHSGALLHTAPVGINPLALAVGGGRVYVANAGRPLSNGSYVGAGSVSVLDARSGVTLRTVPVGVGPVRLAVDVRAHRLLVLTAGGAERVQDSWGWVPSWLRAALPFLPRPATGIRPVSASLMILDTSRL